MAKSGSLSKTAVWILLGLLILGLAGFGATNLSGNLRTIGNVGDKPVSVQAYGRALQQEIRAVQEQTGETLPFTRVREIGLDRAVLQRLVAARALDHEATELGISVGDENVRDQILQIPAFQGLDGNFDREGYSFALQQAGLSEGAFETQLREETSRNLLQSAVINGISMPSTYADTLVNFIGERRDFTWTLLSEADLETPLPAPSDEDLRAYHSENQDRFTLPASKDITYAWLTPEMLVDDVDVDEEALRKAYDERLNEFVIPERRLVERLVYLDQESADQAAAALEVDGTSFEQLVTDRGLALEDVDMGDVGRLELDAAGEAVFGADVGDVVGPLPSSLGPALFRVNAVLPAQSTSFDEAKAELRETVALERARRVIEAQAESLDDLLAGGATLEEIVDESDMTLGVIDWTADSNDGIAAYEDFREAAVATTADDFPSIALLDDGGIFALRVNAELEERPAPFDAALADVRTALNAERVANALEVLAAALTESLTAGSSFEELGLTANEETERTRGAFIPGVPASFTDDVFKMSEGDVITIRGDGAVALVRMTTIQPPDETSNDVISLRAGLQGQGDQALAQSIYDIFTNEVTLRAGPNIDMRAVEAVHANFQ